MSNRLFAVSRATAPALLALWIDARRPRPGLRPHTIFGHAVAALFLLSVIPTQAGSIAATAALVFGLTLPALVYVFVTALWLIRSTQTVLGSSWS